MNNICVTAALTHRGPNKKNKNTHVLAYIKKK